MAKINWTNHLVEILVVVFGILIAFQLNKCSNNSSQQTLVDSHLNYLKEETVLNANTLKYTLKYSKINLDKLDSLIDMVSTKGDKRSINKLSFEVMNPGYLYIRKNAYNSFINSGDIRFLKSFEMKKDIINLYEYYVWTQSLDEGCRITYYDDFSPYVKENFDLVKATVQDDDVYYSKQFLNALSSYRYSVKLKIDKFEDCQKEVIEFQEILAKK